MNPDYDCPTRAFEVYYRAASRSGAFLWLSPSLTLPEHIAPGRGPEVVADALRAYVARMPVRSHGTYMLVGGRGGAYLVEVQPPPTPPAVVEVI